MNFLEILFFLPELYFLFHAGRLLDCPGFVSIVVNDWREDEEILRHDLLVACPPEFNFSVTFPCQPLVPSPSSSSPANLLERHRSNRRQRKRERLLQSSSDQHHPLTGQTLPTDDPVTFPERTLQLQDELFGYRVENQSGESDKEEEKDGGGGEGAEFRLESHLAFEVLLDDSQAIYRKVMTYLAYKTSVNGAVKDRKMDDGETDDLAEEEVADAIFQHGGESALNESQLVIFILAFTILLFLFSATRDYYNKRHRNDDDDDDDCDRNICNFTDSSSRGCTAELMPGLVRRLCPRNPGNSKRQTNSSSKVNVQIPDGDCRRTDDLDNLATPVRLIADKLNPPVVEIEVLFCCCYIIKVIVTLLK